MQISINKSSIITLAFSFSALLLVSGCSDNTTTSDSAVAEPVETTVVETAVVETTVVEEPVAIDPVEETVAVAATDTSSTAEPELLAVNAGEELYNKQCMACHSNGLLNAPKIGDKEAWAPRIAKGKETLYTHSAQGFNKMPAQAVNGVTEAQVKASVDYMLAAVS